MAQLPVFPLWIDAYSLDTKRLTTVEHGAYLLLLMEMWRQGGWLPDDETDLAEIALMTPAQWRKTRARFDRFGFFTSDGGRVTQERLLDELEKSRKKSESARASAGSRWARKSNKNNADKMRSHSDGNADAMLSLSLSPSSKVLSSATLQKEPPPTPRKAGGERAGYSDEFEGFWTFWRSTLDLEPGGKQAAWKAWRKLNAAQREAAPSAARDYAAAVARKQAARKQPDGWNGANMSTWLNAGYIDTYANRRANDGTRPDERNNDIHGAAEDRPVDQGQLFGQGAGVHQSPPEELHLSRAGQPGQGGQSSDGSVVRLHEVRPRRQELAGEADQGPARRQGRGHALDLPNPLPEWVDRRD